MTVVLNILVYDIVVYNIVVHNAAVYNIMELEIQITIKLVCGVCPVPWRAKNGQQYMRVKFKSLSKQF